MYGVVAGYKVKVVELRECREFASPCFDCWPIMAFGKLCAVSSCTFVACDDVLTKDEDTLVSNRVGKNPGSVMRDEQCSVRKDANVE